MNNAPDTLMVTPQQIKRYIHANGWTAITQAKKAVELELRHETDVTGWEIWETKGIRSSDMSSPAAKAITDLVAAYDEHELILTPLQVRSWREEMKMSQPEAAEYLGVSRSTWSRWEQFGIVDHFAGTAAYALAASVASKDPNLLLARTQEIHKFLSLAKTRGQKLETPIQQAIAISSWGGQGYHARLGLGSFGLHQLLADAWDTNICSACSTKNPVRAKFCLDCGSAIEPGKEGTMP